MMDPLSKAKVLGKAGKYDTCGFKQCEIKLNNGLGGIYHAKAEHKTCKIFKTLMGNNCSQDCKYCPNRNHGAKKKVAYKPGELARIFDYLNKNMDVSGLFLSSGVGSDPDKETERMIEAVKLVRKNGFKRYVHFKVLPGTSYDMIKRAAEVSNRMSINIEAPNKSIMNELSDTKEFKTDILRRQSWIKKLSLSGGQSTQVILNNLSTDKEVLRMMKWEYDEMDLRRFYYSRFRPVKGTPLENEEEQPMIRQNRLYNVDFLYRCYDFKMNEFNSIMDDGMLPKEDPKLVLAREYFDSPVDVNECSYEELIRIPGIGPQTAKRLYYCKRKIKKAEDLRKLGARIKMARPFIEIDGKRQMSLMEF